MIRTARLLLRRFRPEDAAPYAAIRAKPEVMRFLPGGAARCATAAQDAERLCRDFAIQWDTVGYGPWAVEDGGTGALIGHAGLREIGGETEVLYLLDTPAWGRGLATEAALAARDFGFGPAGLRSLVGYCVPENAASRAVLRRIGMREDGMCHVFGLDALRHAMEDAPRHAMETV